MKSSTCLEATMLKKKPERTNMKQRVNAMVNRKAWEK